MTPRDELPPPSKNGSLEVLDVLARSPEPLSIAEIQQKTGLNRASLYRTGDVLMEEGWVLRTGSPRRYSISWKVIELGLTALKHNRVRDVLLYHAMELSEKIELSFHISFYESGYACYTDGIALVRGRAVPTIRGDRVPATTTASGKVLLAFQDDEEVQRVLEHGIPRFTEFTKATAEEILEDLALCRERGYGAQRGEYHADISSIAIPVFDSSGRAAAALGAFIRGNEPLAELIEEIREYTDRASRELGYRSARASILP